MLTGIGFIVELSFIGTDTLFTCRRMQWLQRINIAYVKDSQAICEDHFDDCYHGSKGRLLSNAVPRLTGKTGILCVRVFIKLYRTRLTSISNFM